MINSFLSAALQGRPCQHGASPLLHSTVAVNATSSAPEDAPGHSIMQHDMPDDEEPDCA